MATIVKLLNDKIETIVTGKSADFIESLLVPTSAYAADYNGLERDRVATTIKAHLPALGKFTSIVVDTDEFTVTVSAESFPAMLDNIVFCVTENKAFRTRTEKQNEAFKLNREYTSKVEKAENRGRRPSGDKYALGEITFA